MSDDLLSTSEIADALAITDRHARRLLDAGSLGPVTRLGRGAYAVPRRAVEVYAGHAFPETIQDHHIRDRQLSGRRR
jgi:excisionase family DNA binding protein